MARVSAVIPTRNRPQLVIRAVNSVIAQTLTDIEIIVVVDGDDGKTAAALEGVRDPRLRVFVLPENEGASAARNFGVSKATAPWIAFLDDDDEMLPERLAMQLRAGEESPAAYPVILCRVYEQTLKRKYVEPKILPRDGEHISEYIMNKKSIIGHAGGVGSSIIFNKKTLLEKVLFADITNFEDWTWPLQANCVLGCSFEFVPHPLGIYYAEHPSLSTKDDWDSAMIWANGYREYMTATRIRRFF